MSSAMEFTVKMITADVGRAHPTPSAVAMGEGWTSAVMDLAIDNEDELEAWQITGHRGGRERPASSPDRDAESGV